MEIMKIDLYIFKLLLKLLFKYYYLYNNIMFFSESQQDKFILYVLKTKRDGYFIEIGSNHPININNTWKMENELNWKGIMVEYNKDFLSLYKKYRPNSIHVINDATQVDYVNLLKENIFPNIIDYLQIDLEVNNNSTLSVLEYFDNNVFSNYKFRVITFEHDIYTGNFNNTREKSRNIFKNNGYIMVFSDIANQNNPYEDWYVHPDYIDIELINSLKKDNINSYNSNIITTSCLNYDNIIYNYDSKFYSRNLNDPYFCNLFIDYSVNNPKVETYKGNYGRFNTIMSDPANLLLNRCDDAGKIYDCYLTMYNGVKVTPNGYYDHFSEILVLNNGSHEPGKEYMFEKVINCIKEGGTMVELGSYWSFYSITFNKKIKNAINYCIEPSIDGLNIGIENSKLNNANLSFTHGYVGGNFENVINPGNLIDLNIFVKENNINYIDILHSDIQGNELAMLYSIENLLLEEKIKYLFISTHSNKLHYDCLFFLKKCNYKIIASADFDNETFCWDGIIVACHKDNNDLEYTYLGNRKHTPIQNKPYNFK